MATRSCGSLPGSYGLTTRASWSAFRTVSNGVCELIGKPDEQSRADAWAVIDFDGPTPQTFVQERINTALGTDA